MVNVHVRWLVVPPATCREQAAALRWLGGGDLSFKDMGGGYHLVAAQDRRRLLVVEYINR